MQFTWLDTSAYPFQSRFFTVNDHQLHYIDEGTGETILFVHGTPSWSFEFRNIIKVLKSRYRCIAIDHIGFGLSDKPKHYDYSTQNHCRTLEKFILAHKLQEITWVTHDFGTPIALDVAIRHPQTVRHLIILNSWLWRSWPDTGLLKVIRPMISPLLRFLYQYCNIGPKFILPSSFGDHKLPKNILKQYVLPFRRISERGGPLAFAKSILNDQDWFEQLWNNREVISKKPVIFIWGMKDPIIKPAALSKFLAGFTAASVEKLESCGHFPQEEQPQQVSACIEAFFKRERNKPWYDSTKG